jgi:hypothetical protein
MGPAMMCEMIKRNDLLRLSETVIKPFYYQRVQETIAIIRRYLPEDRCLIHKPEGAIFLWLWFKDLPISTELLYQRLKKRGVLMVPGDYFFPGLDKPWPHTHQCMRMNYVPDPEKIEAGVKILAEEIERAWRKVASNAFRPDNADVRHVIWRDQHSAAPGSGRPPRRPGLPRDGCINRISAPVPAPTRNRHRAIRAGHHAAFAADAAALIHAPDFSSANSPSGRRWRRAHLRTGDSVAVESSSFFTTRIRGAKRMAETPEQSWSC